MLPWNLETWLTDEGDRVVRKAADARDPLNDNERLLYEIWLLDTEQRNGGISQYFCNQGMESWGSLSRLAEPALPSFRPFAAKVNQVVGRSDDPYEAIVDSGVDLDAWYDEHQIRLVTELQAAILQDP